MSFNYSVHKLQGTVQHYSWGGASFLPKLLSIENPNHKPFAEYWLGIHAGGPASIEVNQQAVLLSDAIATDPKAALSEPVFNHFGGLPYLFKILDVKDMLSIQVHPTKEYAKVAFEKEEAAGIALNAPNRNYKDINHKPEIMLAMSEFWLLHGFKSEAKILETLENIAEFQVLVPLYKSEGLKGLYQFLMEMEQAQVDSLLSPVVKRALRNKQEGKVDRSAPDWWVAKLYENAAGILPIDKGVFSIYLFNIVCVMPGQGIFQDAGVPHAYLEGQNVELMANSDNVLRGGLTPKHIDVEELIYNIKFESIDPVIIEGTKPCMGESVYPAPVQDFGIASITLDGSNSYSYEAESLDMFLVVEGGCVVNNQLSVKTGEAFVVFPGNKLNIHASGKTLIYRAFVPSLAAYSQHEEN
ncbi:MAG: mannose-6-phosphate isomerase, class I [Sediminibacterium sp.]|jgi:mannose-6-phosphate isomerase|nr:mannose-6-phosphate isomerase, class I [Sediminibacterium sp.]